MYVPVAETSFWRGGAAFRSKWSPICDGEEGEYPRRPAVIARRARRRRRRRSVVGRARGHHARLCGGMRLPGRGEAERHRARPCKARWLLRAPAARRAEEGESS